MPPSATSVSRPRHLRTSWCVQQTASGVPARAHLGHVRQVGACWCEMVGASLLDNYSDLGHNTTVVDMIRMFCPTRGGDSGAPLGNGPTWLGVDHYGVVPGTSSACGNGGIFVDASEVRNVPGLTGDTPNLAAE